MLQRDALIKVKNLPNDTNSEINSLKTGKADNKVADGSNDGLLSSSLYTKLIGLSNYTHPSTHPASMITGLSKVATTGAYTDLTGIPEGLKDFADDIGFGTVKANSHTHSNKTILDGISQDDIDNWNTKDYNDLQNKPKIPTKVSDLTNDANFVNTEQLNSAIDDITALEGQTHTHANKDILDGITSQTYAALVTTRKSSVLTTDWKTASDGLFETTIKHGLNKYVQDVMVIATDATNNGKQIFIDFSNATDLNSVTIASDQAYNADIIITLANPLNI